jgi:predicted ribosome quality control (RQC) complex YloA/Tae2 family protein
MQPCDTITLLALVNELSRQLLNARFEKVQNVAKDEVLLLLRLRSGSSGKTATSSLLLSAHPTWGRLCLESGERKGIKALNSNMALALKKHLGGGRIVALRQPTGERIIDIVFSCPDELGTNQLKILTLELMGKHSNIIFWENSTKQILAVTKTITEQMSRYRELASGLNYVRPPKQPKPNLWQLSKDDLINYCLNNVQSLELSLPADQIAESLKNWLMTRFSGLGRDFAGELAGKLASSSSDLLGDALNLPESLATRIWQLIEPFSTLPEIYGNETERISSSEGLFKPGMAEDYKTYSVLSWAPAGQWLYMQSVNEVLNAYYKHHENSGRCFELRARLTERLVGEESRYRQRLEQSLRQIDSGAEAELYQTYADNILVHINDIARGSEELVCNNLYMPGNKITIPLDPQLTGSQNVQRYYKLASKIRTRCRLAKEILQEAQDHLEVLGAFRDTVEEANSLEELAKLKPAILRSDEKRPRGGGSGAAAVSGRAGASANLPLKVISSDGLVIYAGRNRFQNDVLLSKMAQAKDIWLHLSGRSSAHVLIKMPADGDSPPLRTLEEAGLLVAKLSKSDMLGKVRVLYTQYRHVRKLPGGPGLVRYENEKTFEVDLQKPFPKELERQLEKVAERF